MLHKLPLLFSKYVKGRVRCCALCPGSGHRISSGTGESPPTRQLRRTAEREPQMLWACSVSQAKSPRLVAPVSGAATMSQVSAGSFICTIS